MAEKPKDKPKKLEKDQELAFQPIQESSLGRAQHMNAQEQGHGFIVSKQEVLMLATKNDQVVGHREHLSYLGGHAIQKAVRRTTIVSPLPKLDSSSDVYSKVDPCRNLGSATAKRPILAARAARKDPNRGVKGNPPRPTGNFSCLYLEQGRVEKSGNHTCSSVLARNLDIEDKSTIPSFRTVLKM
jgi:hypothetical protein